MQKQKPNAKANLIRKKTQTKVGRPTKINQEVVRKLETTASLDCTVSETCFYVGISRDTYYRWMKENKELSDRLATLRSMQILKARQEVVRGLEGNPEFALKYLERKLPEEFGSKQKIEHIGDELRPQILYVPAKNKYEKWTDEEVEAEFERRKKLEKDKESKEDK